MHGHLNSLILFLILPVNLALADSINESVIFSEKVYIGAAGCHETTGDYYCEKAVSVYNSDGGLSSSTEKIIGTCVKGGGDCTTVSFAIEMKDTKGGYILVRVESQTGKEVWIKYKKTDLKPIGDWIPELGNGQNLVIFRPNFDEIFMDKNLTKKIKRQQVTDLPDGQKIDDVKEAIEYLQISTFNLDKRKIIEIQVNLLTKDPKLIMEDEPKATEKAQRVPLRKIYFPAQDSKGRPNYWYQPESC